MVTLTPLHYKGIRERDLHVTHPNSFLLKHMDSTTPEETCYSSNSAMDRNQYISEFELGDVEEQEPFMLSDERISSSTTPRNGYSIQHYSAILAGVFFLLSSFAVVEIWRKPSEAQCVKRLNGWCKY